jgi:hypothetical protein
MTEELWFIANREEVCFVLSAVSRLALRCTLSPVSRYQGLSPGLKGLRCEVDDTPPLVLRVEIHGAVPSLPHISSWYGV